MDRQLRKAIPTPPKQKGLKKYLKWLYILILAVIYVWAFAGIDYSGIKETAGQVSKSILNGLFQPDWGYVYLPEGEDLLRGLLETIAIAFLGTIIASIVAFPLAFIAAANINRIQSATMGGKFLLSLIRSFPEIIMALLFITAVGPGSFAGVLALGIHSIGMLGKLSSEAIESMDLSAMEALQATGAGRLQTIWFAVVPQMLPEYLSFVLYRFEINVRAAAILGVIGAGGIGTPLIFALAGRSWDRVGIILLGIIVMVIAIDWISGMIRKRLV
ncbi:phosphonate ABC transporter, permease protein PhnE [Longirhabdus pacifica]|uniref:phosphonate ABC transporter, permease protein PhnE n=1 Tax=Longirhabdus pacifica TaxID=2305227 RepID=UPI001F0CCC2B|nr:phosphonate ABC transporter, permease protein PhnE [Longirhabdus pacifica]